MKKDTNWRLAISPKEKLSLTLSFLAEGLSMKRLGLEYRVGASTAGKIIDETLNAFLVTIVPLFLTTPSDIQHWEDIAQRFNNEWQFPNCIGALDGKHIHMFPPRNSGTLYYNYKEGFSIILMALVDADYKFIAIDVGANGKCCDAGVWGGSKMRKKIEDKSLGIPDCKNLPGTDTKSPYVIIADSGFQLEEFVMRPYPEKDMTPRQRIFNYRLSRARRVSENAFGILSNRWRILIKRILMSPEKVTTITTVCCALHNLLCSRNASKASYIPEGFVDREDLETGSVIPGLWRNTQMPGMVIRSSNNHSFEAKAVRETRKNYFCEEGKVYWQNRFVN